MLLRYELGSRNKIFFMWNLRNVTWMKYWKLTILERTRSINWTYYVNCICECWKYIEVSLSNLKRLKTTSCWCYNKEISTKNHTTHWLRFSTIYHRYYNIINRCNNPDDKSYKNYWGRGIKCEWNSFDEFYNDMFPTYKEWLQIDRINNDWNYCKENCKWSTPSENCNNRRNTIFIEWIPFAEYCKINSIAYWKARSRYRRWVSIL